jgi:hypothetical protein
MPLFLPFFSPLSPHTYDITSSTTSIQLTSTQSLLSQIHIRSPHSTPAINPIRPLTQLPVRAVPEHRTAHIRQPETGNLP